MSHRVKSTNRGKAVKGEVAATSCHVCKAHGKSEYCVSSHNFRDIRGKVCCPTMLENVCSKCGVKGHFQSGCTGAKAEAPRKPYRSYATKAVEHEAKEKSKAVVNVFELLDGDSSDDDAPPAKVTIRQTKVKRSWADMSDDEDYM